MKKSNFTLVEMLVVIAIIAILAGLVMPALGHARAAGQRTNCVNDKKQLITAMTIYAGENDGMMVYMANGFNYAKIMTGLSESEPDSYHVATKEYMPKKSLVCSLAKTDLILTGSARANLATNATGMLNALNASGSSDVSVDAGAGTAWLNSNAKDGKKHYNKMGRFAKVTNTPGGDTVTYVMDRMKSPGGLIIFADTYVRDNDATWWSFIPNGADNDSFVTLAHIGTSVTAFADGRADVLDGGKLKDSGTEVVGFNNSEFRQDKLSDK